MMDYPLWYEVIEDEPSTEELLQRDIKEMFAGLEELLDEQEYADEVAEKELTDETGGLDQ